MTTRKLIEIKNKIEAELAKRELDQTTKNIKPLIEAVSNLLDGVGKGYVEGDYYASTRYYLYDSIEGVKNIRLRSYEPTIEVKIYDKRGYQLPEQIEVRGVVYDIVFYKSDKFDDEISW